MKIIQALFIFSFTAFLMIGCSSTEEDPANANNSDKLTVYTSVYPFQYVVEQIGGDSVVAKTVYPPGADAHTYEPTSKDMTAIADSDAFIFIGDGMEGFATSAADALANQDVELIEIGKYEELFHGHGGGDNHDHSDHTEDGHNHGEDSHGHDEDHEHDGSEHEHGDEHEHDGSEHEHDEDHEHDGSEHNHENDHELDNSENSDTEDGHDHDGHSHGTTSDSHEENSVSITIDGLAGHYHTGDSIQLTAQLSKDSDHDHWHWYTLEPGADDWETVPDNGTAIFGGEATIDGQQIKAVLFGDDHEVVAESDAVTISIDDHTGDHDPHLWIDPLRMIEISRIIKDELIALNPDAEADYNANFEGLEAELLALDEEFSELLATKENKYIMVPHAAYGYWEERYGVKQIAISGLSTSQEPSQKQLTEVISQAEEHNLDYILYEQNSPNRLSEVIQEQIGAEDLTIHNLSVLTDEDIKNKEDYISLMRYNLEILDQVTK
ncbi:zinc ABC transporter substrate-binding protein [Oceanobacillus sp. FSL K6-0127]|uniref:metal ABC transporter solute-binding protein, Zn/Mn family n=1 Tax=Oceanobacillus sp. FSL K6-0127 TaxID=2921420 RepID=UPI0030ED4211